MRSRWAVPVVVVVGMIGLAGCGGSSGTTPTSAPATRTPTASQLTSTAWVLVGYQGSGGTQVGAVAGVSAALAFRAHGALSGSTGCNSFSGTWTQDGSSLTLTTGPMTLMACTSAALTAQEQALLQLLPRVRAAALSGTTLRLTSSSGSTLLTYTAGVSGLSGTSWSATGVNNGRGAVESTTATEALTATFATGGAFSGFGGCNQLSGTWAQHGADGLAITGLASTQMACEGDGRALEAEYTAALGAVATWEVHGDALTLRDAGGATQVTYRLVS